MKTYAMDHAGCGVAIVHLVITPEEYLSKLHPNERAKYSGVYREIAEADIPQDREFRNAWKHDGTSIVVCPVRKAQLYQAVQE